MRLCQQLFNYARAFPLERSLARIFASCCRVAEACSQVMAQLLVIANAAQSGSSAARMAATLEALRSTGWTADCVVTRTAAEAMELTRRSGDYDLVVAAGGDGTVNGVASGLMRQASPAPLGILPCGTANDVARQLGIRNHREAVAAIVRGSARPLDLIEVQSAGESEPRWALNFAACGFAPELLRQTPPRLKRCLRPRFCYWVGFLAAIFRFRAPGLRVTVDGEVRTGPFFHVGAGNFERAGGGMMRHSPGAIPDDGLIELCQVDALNRLEVLGYLPRLARGTHPRMAQVRFGRGTEMSIASDLPVPLAIDGEVDCVTTAARFRVRPGALRVMVPPPPIGTCAGQFSLVSD